MIAETVNQLSSKWWTFLLRGIAAFALAAICLLLPGPTASALVFIVAAYFIIAGVLAMIAGFSFTGSGHWWALVIMGIVQAAFGFFMLTQPGVGPLALAYLFAIWMIMTGSLEISSAVALRNVVRNEFWWIVLGLITLAAGAYFILVPGLGLLGLVFTIGYYAIFAGVSLVGISLRLKSAAGSLSALQPTQTL